VNFGDKLVGLGDNHRAGLECFAVRPVAPFVPQAGGGQSRRAIARRKAPIADQLENCEPVLASGDSLRSGPRINAESAANRGASEALAAMAPTPCIKLSTFRFGMQRSGIGMSLWCRRRSLDRFLRCLLLYRGGGGTVMMPPSPVGPAPRQPKMGKTPAPIMVMPIVTMPVMAVPTGQSQSILTFGCCDS